MPNIANLIMNLRPDIYIPLVGSDYNNYGTAGGSYNGTATDVTTGPGPFSAVSPLFASVTSKIEIANFSDLLAGSGSVEMFFMLNPGGVSPGRVFITEFANSTGLFGMHESNATSQFRTVGRNQSGGAVFTAISTLPTGWQAIRTSMSPAAGFVSFVGSSTEAVAASSSVDITPDLGRSLFIGQKGDDTQRFNGSLAHIAIFIDKPFMTHSKMAELSSSLDDGSVGGATITFAANDIQDSTGPVTESNVIVSICNRVTGVQLATLTANIVAGATVLSFDADVTNGQEVAVHFHNASGTWKSGGYDALVTVT